MWYCKRLGTHTRHWDPVLAGAQADLNAIETVQPTYESRDLKIECVADLELMKETWNLSAWLFNEFFSFDYSEHFVISNW